MKANTDEHTGANPIHFVLEFFKRNLGIIGALVGMMIIVSCMSDNFLTSSNLLNVLRQITSNAFLAFGMTFVILLGGIDLSVGPVLAFSGVFTAYSLSAWGWPLWLAVGMALAMSLLIGLFNGTVTTYTGIAPFVVTLATQTVFRGVAMLVADGKPIRITNKALNEFGTGYIGPSPIPSSTPRSPWPSAGSS